MAICWSGSTHLRLSRQKSNCSSRIVTQFMDVHFGDIHSRTQLENLLSVIVTYNTPAHNPEIHQLESGICDDRN